jgi:hypothetical protein
MLPFREPKGAVARAGDIEATPGRPSPLTGAPSWCLGLLLAGLECVLGVGAMGSATVYQLGLERYDIPHAMGSSHGHTRIIRLAYYEDPPT